MVFPVGIWGARGLEATARQEYNDFAKKHANQGLLSAAARHRQRHAQLMKKGNMKGGHKFKQQAQQELAKAQQLEKLNKTQVNRAYMQDSIKKLNQRWNNGFPGDDLWARVSFQARIKAAFSDFRATGGTHGEFQKRVLDGIQNPFFRMAVLGHPGLA